MVCFGQLSVKFNELGKSEAFLTSTATRTTLETEYLMDLMSERLRDQ